MTNLSEVSKAKNIVIKIGSSLLMNGNRFNSTWLKSFINDISYLKSKRKNIVIVASGAVSLGRKYLSIKKEKISINTKQACAACGQVILMKNFMRHFEARKIKVAQILLTFSDTEDRRKSLNSRETIKTLLELKIIPIINENDSVATDELKFGDNDRLAARVAQLIGSDLLILLSDVEGLYDKNPKKDKEAKLIEKVTNINSKIFKISSSETNDFGSGGMFTKIQAAENWLGGSINISGSVHIDDGAIKALNEGASLLPSGIKKISGNFSKGDIIEILNSKGKKLGRGISYYDSKELNLIKGKKSIYIRETLGYEGRDEIIHRDYLFLK